MKYSVIGCLIIAAALLSLPINAEVGTGENILLNGEFNIDQSDFPEFWAVSSTENITCSRTGGPDGKKTSVTLSNITNMADTVAMRQQNLILADGETYKLSAYIRTKNFKSKHAGVVIHNDGWLKEDGITQTDIPADSDWKLIEKTFKLFPSGNKEYGAAVFAVGMKGEMQVAGLKLEAISGGALKGSGSQLSNGIATTRLVPISPLLHKIPESKPELTFRFYGALPDKEENHECIVKIRNSIIPDQSIQLKNGEITANFAGLACGTYQMDASLRNRQNHTEIIKVSYPISIVDIPVIDRSKIKQLNNLVSELLDQTLDAVPEKQTFTFVNPCGGWVFIALKTAMPAAAVNVKIDDKDTIITSATDRLEAFRYLSIGEHRIAVSGIKPDSRLIVRSIPEIIVYPPCKNSYVMENGAYDWSFMKKHVLQAATTFNGGDLPGTAFSEAKAMGLKWLGNFVNDFKGEPGATRELIEKNNAMINHGYDGFTTDELFLKRTKQIDNYTKILWELKNPENRLIYTYTNDKPSIRFLNTDYFSACFNASASRGKVLFEAYCHPQADEKEAKTYLGAFLTETMQSYSSFFPNAAQSTAFIFGIFNQIPILSIEHNPEVDYKYYLDMQLNLLANNPEFKCLGGLGYWGVYYADEEMVRWAFMLMRHYAVEGKKEMLSDKYGFKYKPGFLKNCDFADGLNFWQASPAAKDSMRVQQIPGYARNCQGRWASGNTCDSVCVMKRTPEKINRISQTAEKLEIGKTYSLQFVTADLKNVIEKKYAPRKHNISVELKGAEILADKSWLHIDKQKNPADNKKNLNLGQVNLNHIVFKAKSSTQVISFNDEKAAPGEELIINFIQLKPYLE